ncbi:RNA ligase RtcB family protein [Sphingopyxis sp. BSN-002]|uniref:RNA ligase RtcB family protein n=1 Tax=Sphingopyxis sp. BSN-002 TaxID=2911495 RepID=UPI001EDA0AE9|nr:RNA ligase RtcB family protein [Sphingopyxis sp. BSN-002]UKK83731.1 RNA ligase RtcB family protein [Sphingopyxis sp. BSN-002]
MTKASIRIIASDLSRVDPLALDQLARAAEFEGLARIVGLPDLHAGRGIAVGAAYWSPDMLFPHLVGSDIGCGMALWETDQPVRRFRLDAAARKLRGLDEPWDGDAGAALSKAKIDPALGGAALGTIGGGNHFAEFQRVERIVDIDRFEAFGFRPDAVWLMVHSGSRGLGQAILDDWTRSRGTAPAEASGEAGAAYLAAHDRAVGWAVLNREIIARRFCEKLGLAAVRRLDICHNSVTPYEGGWLHRKGAAPADRGLVVIPGSRGDFSYLVEPVVGQAAGALCSLAHGAGRKWGRNDAHGRLSKRFRPSDLERTALGGRVICEDRRLIFEEAPQAYKDIGGVVGDLEAAGLIRVIASLRPLLSYKTRRS